MRVYVAMEMEIVLEAGVGLLVMVRDLKKGVEKGNENEDGEVWTQPEQSVRMAVLGRETVMVGRK